MRFQNEHTWYIAAFETPSLKHTNSITPTDFLIKLCENYLVYTPIFCFSLIVCFSPHPPPFYNGSPPSGAAVKKLAEADGGTRKETR